MSFAEGVLWERGFAKNRSNPICLDCHAYARNDNFNYIHAFSYALKSKFAILNNNVALAHCVNNSEISTQGVKTPCYSDYASNFEIMSCNENYDFNHNNFYHNGNNQSLSLRGSRRSNPKLKKLYTKWIASLLRLQRALAPVARNDDSVDCHADKSARTRCAPLGNDGNKLFSRNDYGEDFIFGFGNNFNYGFLFNRKNHFKKNFNQGEER